VGTTLASRENSIVNALLKIRRILEIFPEEDDTSPGTTKSLMTVKIILKRTDTPQEISKGKKHTWWW
jgi:hypothetical protein